jgi:hypothetical protein
MSLNLAGLTAYVDQEKLPLIKKSILKGRTAELITVQPGIKSAAAINILGSTINAMAGACGWNPSGSTALTQRNITVVDLQIPEAICLTDLEAYYTQKMMNPGSYNETIPFEGIYAEEKADQIQALVDDLAWKGNTSTGTGNLALVDGFIKLLTAANGCVESAYSGSFAAGTIIDAVDDMVAKVPSDVIDLADLKLLVGYEVYRLYAKALRDANLFHYTGAEGADFRMMIPGTNVEIVAVRGLNNTNKAYLTPASNLYMGTDLLNDAENFAIWYSQDNDEVRFKAKFKMGVQVAFPEFVVIHK